MHPLLQEIRQWLDVYGATFMVGETFYASPEQAAQYIGPDQLHAGFDFSLLSSKFSAQNFRKAINGWVDALEGKWPNFVLNNHDTSRSATRFHSGTDDARLKVSATMLLTIMGTPFLYYGEEIGMRDIFLWLHQVLDPVSRRYWPLHPPRDGCRSPMQWDDATYAGFSEQKPWLPVHSNHDHRNVEAQLSSPGSLLNFYKKLLQMRRSHSALNAGSMEMIDQDNRKILSYLRRSDDETILVCLNMTGKPAILEIPSHLTGQKWNVLLSQHMEDKEITTSTALRLGSYETLVLLKKKSYN
jgi:alpha-glucosidase